MFPGRFCFSNTVGTLAYKKVIMVGLLVTKLLWVFILVRSTGLVGRRHILFTMRNLECRASGLTSPAVVVYVIMQAINL